MKFQMKTAYIATLLALGSTANAKRMIVTFEDASSKSIGLKSSHQVLAQGKNWFAVDIDKNSMKSMKMTNGFKTMVVDPKRYPMAAFNDSAGNPNSTQVIPYNYYQIQADQLTYQGGQKVCVIDSGIARETGEVGGGNSDFDFSVITGNSDSGTGDWFRDGGAHGTHVAGTIGAADNSVGIIGIAPGVPMHIIKVFNDEGWGYSSDLAQAANLCAAAGANIINMSLGGETSSSVEENAFISFRDNGGLVVAAAGNDGNNVRSFPAGYPAVMMIGGVDADNAKYSGSQFPPCTGGADVRTCVEIAAGAVDVLSTVPAGSGAIASLTVDGSGVAVSSTSNTGTVTDSTYFMGTAESIDAGANGKICIIDRGNVSFSDKVNNCGNSGGTGAVIVNNVAGALSMDITGVTTSIPVVGAALEDRSAIVGSSAATIESGAGDYAKFTGTSMATPTFAGAAALVWSNHPNCTGEDVRAAFKATAQDQGAAGRDDIFGYGIAKAKAASDNLATQSCGGAVNTPPIASFTQSCSGLSCTFNGSASSDSDGSIAGYSWSIGGTGSSVSKTYNSYGTYSVTLTVTDNGGATDSSTQSIVLTNPNQNILSNGVAKTGLSGAKNNQQNWTMAIPSGATNLAFNMNGGSGDADLYVKFGSAPTTSSYDCRSWNSGNTEACNISNAQAGTYHVMVNAYAAYSGADLTGSYTAPASNTAPTASFTSSCTDLTCSFNASGSSDSDGSIASYSWSFGGSGVNTSNTYGAAGTYSVTLTVTDNDGATDTSTSSVTVTAPPVSNNELTNGVSKTGLAASQNNQLSYTMVVPSGASDLSFVMNGGTGDADLYVKFGSAPTTSNYDCRSWNSGNGETCNITTAQTGTYYVMINAYSTFSGASLTGSFTAGGGGQQSIFSSTTNVTIPDNNTAGATSNVSVSRTGDSGNIKITYSIVHTYQGDLKVELFAPNGATAVLREPSGGGTDNIDESKTIDAGATPANGTWGLKVIDNAGSDTGYIDSWSIEFL